MDTEGSFPKRLTGYINETGVRALDRLAEQFKRPDASAPEGEQLPRHATVLQSVVEQWKTLPAAEKKRFMERVTASIVEVVLASAALPAGLKVGRKAVKAGKKIIKRQTKRLRKASKAGKKQKDRKK